MAIRTPTTISIGRLQTLVDNEPLTFERTGNRDHGVLVDDIAVLADASEDQDKVPTPTGYFWLGGMMAMRGPKQQGPVRAVRTLVIE